MPTLAKYCKQIHAHTCSHKSTYTRQFVSVFHYCRHLCTSRTHLNVAIISVFLPTFDTWIKLIHSIVIILRVFMFYKQRVLANCWGRKDSAICASRKRSGVCYCAQCIWTERSNIHRCVCDWHESRCLFDLKSLLRRAVYKTLICARWL